MARQSRHDHPDPPDGPKALDRVMERAARRDAQNASRQKPKRRRKRDNASRLSEDDLAAFYAGLVNSDKFLPASMISNAMCEAMLTRGLVTVERLRERGVR